MALSQQPKRRLLSPDDTQIRTSDIIRIDGTLRQIATEQGELKARVSDLRVLMAEGYVSKKDQQIADSDTQREWRESMETMREDFREHAEEDTRRFNELRKLLYGLIGGMLLLLGGLYANIVLQHWFTPLPH